MHLFRSSWSETGDQSSKYHRGHAKTWQLNNMLLNEQWVREQINGEIKKLLEIKKGISTTYQNLRDTIKSVLREKFNSVNAYVKKLENHPKSPCKWANLTVERTRNATAKQSQD